MNTPYSPQLRYSDIDWNELWQNARQKKSWNSKKASDWDKKATSFAQRNSDSPYVSLFLSQLPLTQPMSILDVGCGPGTLALPLAEKGHAVTCIDYSPAMIELVEKRALDKNITTIKTVNCSWEDDWDRYGVEQHDIAISSRSLAVKDLKKGLRKLNAYADKYVFITDRISPAPFEPDAFSAIGRDFNAGPDYIYTVNCLYSMGIHPSITILQLDPLLTCKTMEEALDSYRWMFHDLSPTEEKKLELYVQSRIIDQNKQQIILRRDHPPRWAMISWKIQ